MDTRRKRQIERTLAERDLGLEEYIYEDSTKEFRVYDKHTRKTRVLIYDGEEEEDDMDISLKFLSEGLSRETPFGATGYTLREVRDFLEEEGYRLTTERGMFGYSTRKYTVYIRDVDDEHIPLFSTERLVDILHILDFHEGYKEYKEEERLIGESLFRFEDWLLLEAEEESENRGSRNSDIEDEFFNREKSRKIKASK